MVRPSLRVRCGMLAMASFCRAEGGERSLAMASTAVAPRRSTRECRRLLEHREEGERMLTLTENASTIVKTLTEKSPDESAGLRISSNNPDNTAFAAAVAPEPEASDQVVESGGARIF